MFLWAERAGQGKRKGDRNFDILVMSNREMRILPKMARMDAASGRVLDVFL